MGGFLLDAHEGVKDAVFRSIGCVELDRFSGMVADRRLGPIEPADARKLLHEAVARAQALGIRPHRDCAAGRSHVRRCAHRGFDVGSRRRGLGSPIARSSSGEEATDPVAAGESAMTAIPPTDRERRIARDG